MSRPIALRDAMKIGLGILKFSPIHFWAMTPLEFSAALRGAFPDTEKRTTRAELKILMQQFPDAERGTNKGRTFRDR